MNELELYSISFVKLKQANYPDDFEFIPPSRAEAILNEYQASAKILIEENSKCAKALELKKYDVELLIAERDLYKQKLSQTVKEKILWVVFTILLNSKAPVNTGRTANTTRRAHATKTRKNIAVNLEKRKLKTLLSKNCDGCYRKFIDCQRRFQSVAKGEYVYCPDGQRHLVD